MTIPALPARTPRRLRRMSGTPHTSDPYRSADHPWTVLHPAEDRATATDRLYAFLASYQREHTYAPSVAEMAEALGWRSLATPIYHLRKLEVAGLIERTRYGRRSIRLLGTSPAA